ncbi:hypothetical protein LJC74_01045 [Eubacteriales bacterium OttesenSCG-928-A19]|nr:hypothetical protein [Eubacteriales bacterium OttesenSCG-928-A19]
MLFSQQSESPSLNLMVMDESGNRFPAVHVSTHLIPGKQLSLNFEVVDEKAVADNAEAITEQVTAFVQGVLARAGESGIPVPIAE